MPKPNLLILMIDGARGRLFQPGSPCRTPHLLALADKGVRITRAYAPNPICSPSRASLMTGLLPHNHGVYDVIHSVPDTECCLHPDKPHWAQRLVAAGYRTGYFGKWHVERSLDLARFGWQVNGSTDADYYRSRLQVTAGGDRRQTYAPGKKLAVPDGYSPSLLYGVVSEPATERAPGRTTAQAEAFLHDAFHSEKPWCCFVSLSEPNEPPVCGRAAFDSYPLTDIAFPSSQNDPLTDQPGLYRKAAGLWKALSGGEKRELLASQYAAITEIDSLFGRLLEQLDRSAAAANTVVLFTSDHGNLLGAHGLLGHNVSAYEELYNIPMIVRGPGIPQGRVSPCVVSLMDVGDTLLELCGLDGLNVPDSKSFAPLLFDPDPCARILREQARQDSEKGGAAATSDEAETPDDQADSGVDPRRYSRAYAEYFGARYRLTQRVLWDDDWKFVFNGFDRDELYHLSADPTERRNWADHPNETARADAMMAQVWEQVRDTGDKTLEESHWPGIRWARVGPLAAKPVKPAT